MALLVASEIGTALEALRGVSLRRVRDGDEDFLLRLYAETRADEMDVLPWAPADKDAFVRMQFRAQQTYYQTYSPSADFLVIEKDGAPIGRLYLQHSADEVRIVDISLLAGFRGSSIGTHLIREVLHDAADAGKPVRLHVERFNRALTLYSRLGFHRIADEGAYYLMEWTPIVRLS